MLAALIAQLRFAASVAFGVAFDLRSLERLVEAVQATRRELGALGSDALEGVRLDDEMRQDLQLRRFRAQVVRAVRDTAYYGPILGRPGLNAGSLTAQHVTLIPPTQKASLQSNPDAFIRRGTRPAYRCTTTGTTGRTVSVAFSADELRIYQLLAALALLQSGTVGEDDVVQISTSARATLGNLTFAGACSRVGALVHLAGLVSPAHTLGLLAEPRSVPGKKARVSVLMTYPSHLGELVEVGTSLGYTPQSFGVERLIVGGELVTDGLKARARQLFGDVAIDEGYGMTEIWPLGGLRCPDDHLHFEPAQGLVEVVDPVTRVPAEPGQVGSILATPFPPYRQTTVLLRYDTEDLVRRLAEPPTCPLAHLPATGHLLGKLRQVVQHERGWTYPREVLEALEAVEDVPLPARCGFWPAPGGVGVNVVVRSNTAATRRQVERSLEARGVPLRALDLVHDPAQLRHPLPLRCDLRETAFPNPTLDGPDGDRACRSAQDAGSSSASAGSGGLLWT